MPQIIGITVLGKKPPCSLQQYEKGRKYKIREIKMTPESFEWGVILHLERQPRKLRQKGKKMPLSHQLPLKIYKWSVNRNEFLLGFRHHLLRGERDKKKEMEKTGKLCLFEGKMLSISNMMKMYQRCQPDVDMLIFFMSSFTEEWVQRTFWVFFRIWIAMHC